MTSTQLRVPRSESLIHQVFLLLVTRNWKLLTVPTGTHFQRRRENERENLIVKKNQILRRTASPPSTIVGGFHAEFLMKPRVHFVTTLLVAFSISLALHLTAHSEMAQPESAKIPTAEEWIASVTLTELKIHPETLTLEHARDGRRVLVSGKTKDGTWVDVTPWAVLTPANATVKVYEDGYIFPTTVGETNIVVTVKGREYRIACHCQKCRGTACQFCARCHAAPQPCRM